MDTAKAMEIALEQARAAVLHGDVPIGAVVLFAGEVVAAAHNERELRKDPTAHAELLALGAAAAALGRSDLCGCSLVVTLEPCVMCAGALVAAGVDDVVFAAFDEKAGACGSRYNLCSDVRLGRGVRVVAGPSDEIASLLLTDFFAARRSRS